MSYEQELVTVHFGGITHIDMTYGLAVQQMQKHIDGADATIAALKQRVAELNAKLEYAAEYIHSPDGKFTFPDGDSVDCSGGVSYSDMVYKVTELERERDEAIIRYAGQANDADNKHKTAIGQLENARAKLATLTKKLETAKETERILRIAFADAIQYRKIAVEHGAPSVNQGQFERLVENHLEELADIEQSEKQAVQPVEKKKD